MFNSKIPDSIGTPMASEGVSGPPPSKPLVSFEPQSVPDKQPVNHPPHSKIWKRYGDLMMDGVNYLNNRATGKTKSLRTLWPSFNKIGLNGMEWQSLYVIGARPGIGKTLIAGSITRDLQQLNPDQTFSVLHFQFEMLGRNMAIRELSSTSNLDVRYLQSAQDEGMPPLSETDYNKLSVYAQKQGHRREYVVDTATTVAQMQEIVEKFYAETRLPFVVTLDHTLLVKKGASETSKQQTLELLAISMTNLKNKYPVIFIVLTQLNREIDNTERHSPGKLSQYPSESDVFGSDSLLQCSDVMIAVNKPSKQQVSIYGPQRWVIEPHMKDYLAFHILKNRFGDTSIQWYHAHYKTMTLEEVTAPKQAPLPARKS